MSPYDGIPRDPLKEANRRAHDGVKKMGDAPPAKVVKTVGSEAIERAQLLELISRAIPFIHSEAEAFRGFCDEMAECASQLENEMTEVLKRNGWGR